MLDIYTDGGSRHNPGLAAYAFVVVQDNQVIHQESSSYDCATNNQMELLAILQALRYLKANHPNEPATIHSDSQYSVNCINIWYGQWLRNHTAHAKANIGLIQSIVAEQPTHTSIVWVKGHSANPYNNLADRLVNRAMDRHHEALPPPVS